LIRAILGAFVLEEQLLAELAGRIQAETEDRLTQLDPEAPLARDTALADIMLGYLEEAGLTTEHELCPYEDQSGRNRCRIVGYALPEESTRLELFTALYVDDSLHRRVGRQELGRLCGHAARFFACAASLDFDRFRDNPEALAAIHLISEQLDRIEEVRVHVLTNGIARDRTIEQLHIENRLVQFSVCDIERLQRLASEDVSRDRIEIDFQSLLGRPIACLEMKPAPNEYQTYLLILPGDLIYSLYEEFGPRLFEFNVRSFLQTKGQVNKGLRATLRDEPERFLAYNNGLTATADMIEVGLHHGETVIRKIKGLQIVNGAQTTASIHRAKKVDRFDISRVAVATKLTHVEAPKLSEFVPLIARYANTQNPVQLADLSANNEFHIRLEQLSEKTWCPGEETRWFYERARGAYQVAAARHGTTPAKKREFEFETPKSQRFSKTDLAKYHMSWWRLPHVVSKGAQKNFSAFMVTLRERYPADWQPDADFYRDTVALAILFTAMQSTVRKAKLGSYGAQVVTYMLAKLSADYGDRLDLAAIWENQSLSPELLVMIQSWVPLTHQAIIEGAGRRNVTEYCKKEECWSHIGTLSLPTPVPLPPELAGPQKPSAGITPAACTSDTSAIAKCIALDAAAWGKVIAWASASGNVASFDLKVAHTVSGYALERWQKKPSDKQAQYGARVIEAARRAGVIS
jgi:hypothetical protein